jgi:hypothetical protein
VITLPLSLCAVADPDDELADDDVDSRDPDRPLPGTEKGDPPLASMLIKVGELPFGDIRRESPLDVLSETLSSPTKEKNKYLECKLTFKIENMS